MKKPIRKKRYLLKQEGSLKRKRGNLTGVCAGLGEYFKVDPMIVRVGFIAGTFFSVGLSLLVYLGLTFFLPMEGTETTESTQHRMKPNESSPPKKDSDIFPDAELANTPLEVCWQCDTVSKNQSLFCHKCGAKL